MDQPIEEAYFNWLCAKVQWKRNRNYSKLLEILYHTEFTWTILGDRNRESDGLELRTDFLRDCRINDPDPEWLNAPCSVLEVLIALACRAEFETGIPVRDWFWTFIKNLRLDDYRYVSPRDIPVIEEILNTFVWRTYSPNGDGGLFPMRSPNGHDQRQIELWYQFFEYLENEGLF